MKFKHYIEALERTYTRRVKKRKGRGSYTRKVKHKAKVLTTSEA